MLSGDNGILQRATDAKIQTGIGQEKEIVALAYNSALAKKVSNGDSTAVTATDLNTELTNQGASADGDNPITVTFTESQNTYTIDSNGNIEKNIPPEPMVAGKTVKESKGNKIASNNTVLVDDYGNNITIPKGFKIATDSADNVTGGIVIEDVNAGTSETVGSQFVWIPVGDIYTDTNNSITNIELCRCGFNQNGEKVSVQEGYAYSIQQYGAPEFVTNQWKDYQFSEDSNSNHNSSYSNAIAKNITDFISRANNGYYIGRFEAGISGENDNNSLDTKTNTDGSVKPIIKYGCPIWNAVSQPEASIISQNMYENSSFDTDLMNSYAWDTAILFLQAFDDRTETAKSTKYSIQTGLTNSVSTTGSSGDIICNIYDMASNCYEWNTETCNYQYASCTYRGGGISRNMVY